MTPEEQLLLQQQQKLEGIEQQQRYNLFRSPGQVQGETTQQFAAGKRAANSQAQGYGANPAPVSQPSTQTVTETQTKNMVTTGGIAGTGQRQQNKPITNMDELAQAMGYTSPQEEERLRKASVANQRIMAVGDALRHIGNIFNTINYAPAQQFNNPVAEEQARYQRVKALRDKANQTYLAYQQAKAAQDQKARQWEAEYNMKSKLTAAQIKSIEDKAAEMIRHNKSVEAVNEWKAKETARMAQLNYEEKARTNKARTGIMQQNANTNRDRLEWQRNRGGGRGSGGKGMDEYTTTTETTYNYDNLGKRTGTTTTKKRTVNGQAQPTQTTTKKQLPGQGSSTPQQKKKQLPK